VKTWTNFRIPYEEELVEVWCGVCCRISVGTVGQLCKEQKAKVFITRVSILFVLFTSELEPG